MDQFFSNISRRKIKVTVLASYPLIRQSLRLLIDGDRQLTVLDAVGTIPELIEKIARRSPNVILLCLMEKEGKNIEALHEIRRLAPHIKAVVLSAPNSLDQTAALKLGVTGIVGTNQSARVLIRAITQVSEGEVWLNQKMLAQLLDDNLRAVRTGGKNKHSFKNDELTNRELEVVRMIGLGLNNRDISKKLFISEATVRHHLSSIYSKLQVEDRLNLAIYAYRRQIVLPLQRSIPLANLSRAI